jgi:hypothetical protein
MFLKPGSEAQRSHVLAASPVDENPVLGTYLLSRWESVEVEEPEMK